MAAYPGTVLLLARTQTAAPRFSLATSTGMKTTTYIEQERQRRARRRQQREDHDRPVVPDVREHERADEREDSREDRAQDHGRGDRARAVDRVGVHEVLDEPLHDLREARTEGHAREDGHEPENRWVARPEKI